MQRTAIAILLMLAAAGASGQSSNPTPPPEIKKWGVWIGDWAFWELTDPVNVLSE
jgi:hypothetical protein